MCVLSGHSWGLQDNWKSHNGDPTGNMTEQTEIVLVDEATHILDTRIKQHRIRFLERLRPRLLKCFLWPLPSSRKDAAELDRILPQSCPVAHISNSLQEPSPSLKGIRTLALFSSVNHIGGSTKLELQPLCKKKDRNVCNCSDP